LQEADSTQPPANTFEKILAPEKCLAVPGRAIGCIGCPEAGQLKEE